MSDFSEILCGYMKRHFVSTVDLSKETGIDRTALYRYSRGTRIPSSLDVVEKIADALQMSGNERKILLEEYDKLIYGESSVYSFQYMKNMLIMLNETTRKDSMFFHHWRMHRELEIDTNILCLNSKEEIATCVLNLMEYVAGTCHQEKIYMVMQPVYEEIQKYILPIFGQSDIKVEQIICFEKNREKGYENLKIFQEIFPLCFGYPGYEPFYYYDSLSSHINSMSGMANFIIVRDYIIQFDIAMQNGVVIKETVYRDAMYQQYQFLKAQSKKLLMRDGDVGTVQEFANQIKDWHGGCIFRQPCMALCISRKWYEEHLYNIEGKEDFINGMVKSRGDWIEGEYIPPVESWRKCVSYGTKSGMEEFMRTGRIEEFPSGFYSPFTVRERQMLLERMIRLAQEERIAYRLLSEEMGLFGSIQIYWDEQRKRLSLNRVRENSISQIIVGEHSIYRTFHRFLEFLEKKEMVMDEKESLKWLIKLRE